MEDTLDLDEYEPLQEDTTTCMLCMHHNAYDLDNVFARLCHKVSKHSLYQTLFQFYEEKASILRRQGMLSKDQEITIQDIENHYESHHLHPSRSLTKDLRVVEKLQDITMQRMVSTQHELNRKNLNMWRALSQYKIQLFHELNQSKSNTEYSKTPYINTMRYT